MSNFSFSRNVFTRLVLQTRKNQSLFGKGLIIQWESHLKCKKKIIDSKKLSKWVENTVGKGEIARHEQFHLFSQCFRKTCYADMDIEVEIEL